MPVKKPVGTAAPGVVMFGGKKRALLIGISYEGTAQHLKGCETDVRQKNGKKMCGRTRQSAAHVACVGARGDAMPNHITQRNAAHDYR